MDYKIETTPTGRVRVKDDFTPARRYSFLVGQNENSHTAQSRLIPILEDTEHDPTIADLEDSFSVESVTKEFFEQYRELYLKVKEALDNLVAKDKDIRTDFEEKGVDTVDFAKKLLGQIVFLYFLQKKGWFGVKRKAAWGTGSKGFLRELFQGKHGGYRNFFDEILEPLFYNTLAVPRTEDYADRFDCKIPFLNGGLFDPLNNYDWVETEILLPNELFSNAVKIDKTGDVGTGILDVFDRFNFTVKEDEPLEKEVAVDPEMLGKVFENLLEVKDRKSKGTYYTPREIVHYMCQESLITYLATELDSIVPLEEIATLIKHGETAQENDTLVTERGEERGRYKYKLPESVRDNADEIDHKLSEIKVCDPAAGSGAFLVGMMTEIVRARLVLTQFMGNGDRTAYDLKRHAIQSSLHGVDIDPGAVEIAKLRLWLSLIVDEENYKQIKPLPNLDYKIMQGNSLLEEYEGIKLIDEKFFEKQEERTALRARLEQDQSRLQREYISLNTAGRLTKPKRAELEKRLRELEKALKELDKPHLKEQDDLGLYGKSAVHSKAESLLRLHEDFFSAYNKRQKEHLKQQIDALTWDLIQETLKLRGKNEKLQEVQRFQQTNTRPFFLWRLNFADVFSERSGFDAMIANPPYLRIQEIQKNDPHFAEQLKKSYTSATGSFDIYACFVEQALRLTRKQGNIAFILPHKFFQAAFGRNLRGLISSQHALRKIIDFGSSQVFETATTYTCLLFLSRDRESFAFAELKPNTTATDLSPVFDFIDTVANGESDKVATVTIPNDSVTDSEWHFTASKSGAVLAKLQEQPRRLSEVCKKMFQGIATSADKIYFLDHISSDGEVITGYSRALEREIRIERGFVKPLLKGADIHRYQHLSPRIWCIVPYRLNDTHARLYSPAEVRKNFPLAWKYLMQNRLGLESRERGKMAHEHFYAYIYPKNLMEFEQKKIVTPEISFGCNMTYDFEGVYHNTKCYSFVFNDNVKESPFFFLALLNSKLLWFFLSSTGYVLRGGYFVFKTNYLMPFPLPAELGEQAQKPFVALVEQIMGITKRPGYQGDQHAQSRVRELESEIDLLVYKLYGLTSDEIRIVENAAPR